MFPDKEDEIRMISENAAILGINNTFDPSSRMVKVVESWHLPSGVEAEDGKLCITINNALLVRKVGKSYFPFVFYKWSERPFGFGQRIAEQLTGLQLEINKILRTIQISMHLVSVPKLLVKLSSKIVPAHLNNKIGGIIKYVGKPHICHPWARTPELFLHLDRLYTRSFEVIGVSQLSAQSTKPSGLNSGKALRTYNDLESERF